MTLATVSGRQKTVADPCPEYESLLPIWKRCRAVCSGEQAVKDHDGMLDLATFTNLLIPFSSRMRADQYRFYKAEAEFPGVSSEFLRMLLGGLLRKPPTVVLPESLGEEARDWILNQFSEDGLSLLSFLEASLTEELTTSRAWVYVDYPKVLEAANMTAEEFKAIKPYPLLWSAETVINWQLGKGPDGATRLKRVVTKEVIERFASDEEVHPDKLVEIRVHELDKEGYYQIRVYEAPINTNVVLKRGSVKASDGAPSVKLVDTITNILKAGERLTMIPAWPLNGSIAVVQPILGTLISKELHIYNKMSRRNHLLYGAATYTPWATGDLSDPQINDIVGRGLGSWLFGAKDTKFGVLETPTEALADMEKSIAAALEEMARLGVRMLSPETEQSGVALEIRNAVQNARISSLNTRVSAILRQVIAFMLSWRYQIEVLPSQVEVSLSDDFNPLPLGADWLRLATEWYQQGFIPRSLWLILLKHNDLVPPDYNDEEGQVEIMKDAENAFKLQANADKLINQGENDGETRGSTR